MNGVSLYGTEQSTISLSEQADRCLLMALSQPSPVTSPNGVTSMSRALGREGRPGSVATLPARGYKKPAPTEARMSDMGKVYPLGLPLSDGS